MSREALTITINDSSESPIMSGVRAALLGMRRSPTETLCRDKNIEARVLGYKSHLFSTALWYRPKSVTKAVFTAVSKSILIYGAIKQKLERHRNIKSKNPLQQFPRSKLTTLPSSGKLRGNVFNGFWA